MRSLLKISAVFTLLILAGCSDNFVQVAPVTGETIVDKASGNDNFNILTALLKRTGLGNNVPGSLVGLGDPNSGSFTVFAPTDDAFVTYLKTFTALASADEAAVITWINGTLSPSTTPSIATLVGVLNYHTVSSVITSDKLAGGDFATLQGARLSTSNQSGTFRLNGNNPGVGTGAAGNGATLVNAVALDLKASNGVIHAIDKVLTPISTASIGITLGLSISYATNPPTVTGGTTSDTNGNNYNLLAAALRVTGLVPALLPNQTILPDFTVFAPTDAAFVSFLLNGAAYSAANETAAYNAINGLSASSTPSLPTVTELLKYHVVAGRVLSTDLSNAQVVNTLQLVGTPPAPNTFTIGINGSTVTLVDKGPSVSDPIVTSANILTNAGVIHQINGVLRN